MLSFRLAILGILLTFAPACAVAGEISYLNDVMAVFSKAGCNQGVCHGNKFGKGGFRLSLRGQDPRFDYLSLSRNLSGRRVNVQNPAESLLLLKPTMEVAHEGGRRFDVDSVEYKILLQWLEANMPFDSDHAERLTGLTVTPQEKIVVGDVDEIQLTVLAQFSNGTSRDVTRLAVYEPVNQNVTVSIGGLVQREDFGETWVNVRYLDQQFAVRLAFISRQNGDNWKATNPHNYVDEHVFAKLKQLRLNPTPLCSDEVFLRRSYLDLLGLLPTSVEAQRFISDHRPDKRARLIEELLDRNEFADFWALKWSDLLRNEEKTLDRKGVENFHAWIRRAFALNMPLDQFVRELIVARGSTYENPPANFYRGLRDPITRAESSAQLFLGIRLQCAKCHNHPFDRWTQDDYYGWANLFAQVNYKTVDNTRKDRLDKNEFIGEQIVFMSSKGHVKHAVTGQPAPSRFLGAADRSIDEKDDRLLQLSAWIVSPENRQFARAQVNRIWYQLIGRGIVEPIDDFRVTNPPSNPKLLDALTDDFIASGYDVKCMIRTIINSHVYQAALPTAPGTAMELENFARPVIRRLTAEQILDAISQVAGKPVAFNGFPMGMRASQLPGVRAIRPRDKQLSLGDQFLLTFGKPQRMQTCECERSNETTLSQTLQMVSGPLMNQLLAADENRLDELLQSKRSPAEIINDVFWSTLTRSPTAEEMAAILSKVSGDLTRETLEDLLWALLNSNEFLLRH
ncbi:DUF1549 and DUF1553 domain-containing protein [Symmachiella macrocystis]|uniref:DUF1549 and DUF1553 domain-containing protein n=1 Tax=Symmachiella macrocystis TaxID=2527985 RepID=UPI0018D302A2|nr:DUF1549 and DUF1553 domain-containing protein [Symmachiella macrocystis]